jgi:phosphoribosylformylglycinamidine synthase subunit PurQ / glutaminase
MVKVLVLRTAGTNCNEEMERGFSLAGADVEQVHISELISGNKKLASYDVLALPGGFSYGDYISAGKILANQLARTLRADMEAFIASGKVVVGLCNGFQTLVRTGFLPGDGMQATLAANASGRFECRWVRLKRDCDNPLTVGLSEMAVPVAHGEGNFIADDGTIALLEKNGQVLFRYSGSSYPANPNGSMKDIAGICNRSGNVIGMMPHPERHLTCENHPQWTRRTCTEGEGLVLFRNIVEYIKRRDVK